MVRYSEEVAELHLERKELFSDLLQYDFETFIAKHQPDRLEEVQEGDYSIYNYIAENLSNGSGHPTEHKPLMGGIEINEAFTQDRLYDTECYAMLIAGSNPETHFIIGYGGDAWIASRELGEKSSFDKIMDGGNNVFDHTEFYEAVSQIYHLSNKDGVTLNSFSENKWQPSDEYIDLLSTKRFKEELGYDTFEDALFEGLDRSAVPTVDVTAFLKHLKDTDYDLNAASVKIIAERDYEGVKNDIGDGSEFRLTSRLEVFQDLVELKRQIDVMVDEENFANAMDCFGVDPHSLTNFDAKEVKAELDKSFSSKAVAKQKPPKMKL